MNNNFMLNKKFVVIYLLLFFASIMLISCNDSEKATTIAYINVPSTDFVFQPIESFQVTETNNTLFLRMPGVKDAPLISIWGKTFPGDKSRDAWLDEMNSSEFYLSPQDIEVNNISGFLAKYEHVDLFSVRAVLSTDEEGLVLIATSHPDHASKTETIFETILDSVSLQ